MLKQLPVTIDAYSDVRLSKEFNKGDVNGLINLASYTYRGVRENPADLYATPKSKIYGERKLSYDGDTPMQEGKYK